MIKDFPENNAIAQSIAPSAKTADANGTAVDLLGYEAVTFIATIGAQGDTLSSSVYIELEVEESDDNFSTSNDVADADLSDYVDGTNDGTFAKIDASAECSQCYATTYRGSKRYVRPVINVTGTHTNGTDQSIIAIKHGYKYQPVG